MVKDLPWVGQQVQVMLHVRKFFCDTTVCSRKIFAERLPQLVAPWAHMTTRLCQALQAIGLATCGRLGARLASRLGIATSWMTIVRQVTALPNPTTGLGMASYSRDAGHTGDLHTARRARGTLSTGREPPQARFDHQGDCPSAGDQ
jgi:hypothetical protein